MKTLYISDLDGTLLNENAELSNYTVKTLNHLIANGLFFTAATARTAATAVHILKELRLTLPVVLMNGGCVYDLKEKRYVKKELLSLGSCKRLLSLLQDFDLPGFLFTIEGETLHTFYERADTPHAKKFIEERETRFGKYFTKVKCFSDCLPSEVVYFSVAHKKELLLPFYTELKKDKEITIEFYKDVYNEGMWYLEVASANASKYNAALFLKEKYQFEKIVSFGDNLNDLPLFKASDLCYAVENAKDEVKKQATAVIERNTEDGVARFLYNYL